ncbi:MAG: SDR family oxidoreductase [Bdellovibrionales bacterium]|nr:SDR family oxidoreductase [Bdellovibrionales bacterium]
MFGFNRGAKALAGKHAVVTGAGRGIGARIAHRLAENGANLTLLGRSLSGLESTAADLRAAAKIEVNCLACDVSQSAQVEASFQAATEQLGAVSVLVNNAGQAESAPLVKTDEKLWQNLIDVNLLGVFLCTRAVLPQMISQKSGRIINIASTAGLRGYPYVAAYCAAKHGVIGLTRSVALEVVKHGITVNAVCPGFTKTDLLEESVKNVANLSGRSQPEVEQEFLKNLPQGRFIEPDQIASAVIWLSLSEQSSVTGQTIAIAGGESL